MLGAMTDQEVMAEVGARLRAQRLRRNVSVEDLAARAGLNRNTVLNAEAGANPRLKTLLRILRALGGLDAIDAFLPPPGVSPLQLMRTAGRARRRARRASRG